MANALTSISASGVGLPSVQPVQGSITGSPFSVATTSIQTLEVAASGILIFTSEPVHIAFNNLATTADIILPSNQWFHFPTVSRDLVSFLQAGATAAVVYVEAQRETA